MSSEQERAFEQLVAGYVEGDLPPAGRTALEALLKSDPALRDQFLHELELNESLHIVTRDGAPPSAEAGRANDAHGAAAAAAPDSEFVETILHAHRTNTPVARRAPTPSARVPALRTNPARKDGQSQPRRVFLFAALGSLAACALLILGWSVWQPRIAVPGAGASETVAVLSHGTQVTVARGATLIPVTAGLELQAGDQIVTTEDGSAVVALRDEATTLQLGATSTLVLHAPDANGKRIECTGVLNAQVAHQLAGQSLRILTPNAEVIVVGTQFRLQAVGGTTRIDMQEGRVNLTDLTTRQSIPVTAGQFAQVQDGLDLVAQNLPKVDTHPQVRWETVGTVGIAGAAGGASDPIRSLVFLADGRSVAGGSQGVFLSNDHGQHWSPLNNGLAGQSIRSLSVTATGDLLAGSVSTKREESRAWCFKLPAGQQQWLGGDVLQPPGFGAIEAFAFDSKQRILALSRFSVGLLRSNDGGLTYHSITENNVLPPACLALWQETAPDRDGALYVGTAIGVLRSNDDAATWQCVLPLNTGNPEEGDECTQVLVTADRHLLCAVMNSRTNLSRLLQVPLPAAGARVDPTVKAVVAMGLPRRGRLQSLVELADGRVFTANSQNGVFVSLDHGQTWAPTAAVLPSPWTTTLTLAPDGMLYTGLKDGRLCRLKP